MSKAATQSWTVGPPPRLSGERDPRIDFFRGVALLCIYLDHIPGNLFARLTLHNYGFSDAAELFVLLAGVSAALAYGSQRHSTQRILLRAAIIWIAQIVLVVAAAGLVTFAASITGDSAIVAHPLLASFGRDFPDAFARTARLALQPPFFNILPLYVALLGFMPLALLVMRAHRALGLLLSFAIWALGAFGEVNFVTSQGPWFFNPLCWQLPFCIGVFVGLRKKERVDGSRALPGSRLALLLAVAFLAFAALYAAPWRQIPMAAIRTFRLFPDDLLGVVSKTDESLWRLAHIVCLAYVATWFIRADARWLRHPIAREVSAMGKRSLLIFLLASIASTLASLVLLHFGDGLLLQTIISVVGMIALLLARRLPRRLTSLRAMANRLRQLSARRPAKKLDAHHYAYPP